MEKIMDHVEVIKKLMILAAKHPDTEEGQSAGRKAKMLMEKYNIKEEDLTKTSTDISSQDSKMWKPSLDDAIGDRGLKAAINDGFNRDRSHPISVEELKKLKKLNARRYEIYSLENLGFASKLKYLDLSENPLRNWDDIKYLNRLRRLNLSQTGIGNIDVLGNCFRMEKLELAELPLCDINSIRNMQHLRYLNLSGSGRIMNLNVIHTLPVLRTFIPPVPRKKTIDYFIEKNNGQIRLNNEWWLVIKDRMYHCRKKLILTISGLSFLLLIIILSFI